MFGMTSINPPPTGYVDRNGRVICYHDIVALFDDPGSLFWVVDDPHLGVALASVSGWTKEKLTHELSKSMVVINL